MSKLNRLARSVLEAEVGQIWLTAEISNFVAASSGHWYFTLKDDRAQVKGAMFKGANRKVDKKPKEGDKVLVRANVGLYEPRGDYQLIIEHIEPEGEGLLKQKFDLLKRKLADEGLFSQDNKQPIPEGALKIGVVTSSNGAALHDILTVLKRRNPGISITIYPTQVQGENAPASICEAINTANSRNEVELLIVGRGGGSLEDLWCFNDEKVARCIFSSSIPIVCAVGHETDVSIADFAADLRAPTPSAAAELVSQDQSVLAAKVIELKNALAKSFRSSQTEWIYRHQILHQALLQNHPQKQLEQKYQFVDQLHDKLSLSFSNMLKQQKRSQYHLNERLMLTSPGKVIQNHQQALSERKIVLQNSCAQLLDRKSQGLANIGHLLDTVSPLATLSRGYNIGFKEDSIVKSINQVQVGDTLKSKFSDGEIVSQVKEVVKTKTSKSATA